MKIINREQYESMKKMLQSDDQENWNVALTIMEDSKMDKNNVIPLILLCKFGKTPNSWIHENYPKFYKKVAKLTDKALITACTFNEIFDIIAKKEVPSEAAKIAVEEFTESLKDKLETIGYDFIKDIHIEFNE